jgi:hypothetical protein
VRWWLDYAKHCWVVPGTYCEVQDEPLLSNMITACTHKGIALRPTRNLQGSVKFYCLNTGRILKWCSFTKMPMPTRRIKRVDTIRARENQGREFQFVNRNKEPLGWTDEVPEDGPKFQGLLEDKEEAAVYPDISVEHPGVTLEDEVNNIAGMVNDNEPDFCNLAAISLDNVGINPQARLQTMQNIPGGNEPTPQEAGPALIDANNDKIVYKVTFDLPNAGLVLPEGVAAIPLGKGDIPVPPPVPDKPIEMRRYPTQSRRSAVVHQPYGQYAPRRTFLQLGEARAHGSVLEASRLVWMSKEERLLATTMSNTIESDTIDDVEHKVDSQLTMMSEDEVKVWGYIMTQYSLKVGL